MSSMIGLVNYGNEPGSVELREIPVPEIGAEDVLLSVQAVSVCGSDLHQYHGKNSWRVNYPVVLGHEFAGVIAKAGSRVCGFKEGDRVTSETAAVLPHDSALIRRGLYNLDPGRLGFGYGVDGAMAQYVKVPARCLHHVSPSLAMERAALTEPCCVAYNAVCVNSHVRPGDSVAVIGPGPIGLLCAMMAKLSGAGYLAVIGIPADAKRLEVAVATRRGHRSGREWRRHIGVGKELRGRVWGRPGDRCGRGFRIAEACARDRSARWSNHEGGMGTATAQFFPRSSSAKGSHAAGKLLA